MREKTIPRDNAEKEPAFDSSRSPSPWWQRAAVVAWVILTLGVIIVLGLRLSGLLTYRINKEIFPELDLLAQFGNSYGVVSSLVSLITLFIAWRVLELQREELKKTTDTLNAQYREAQIQREEERINEAIEDYRAQLNSIVMPGKNQETKETELWCGRDGLFHVWRHSVFFHLYELLRQKCCKYPYPGAGECTLFNPGMKLHGAAWDNAPGPFWIAEKLHDSKSKIDHCMQDVRMAEELIKRWRELSLIHKYQIEPLVLALENAFRRIAASKMELEERKRHSTRLVSQLSSIELNFLLCYCLFEQGRLGQDLRKTANYVGLFNRYEPGLDVLEHVLLSLARNKENLVTRLTNASVNPLASSAFADSKTAMEEAIK